MTNEKPLFKLDNPVDLAFQSYTLWRHAVSFQSVVNEPDGSNVTSSHFFKSIKQTVVTTSKCQKWTLEHVQLSVLSDAHSLPSIIISAFTHSPAPVLLIAFIDLLQKRANSALFSCMGMFTQNC